MFRDVWFLGWFVKWLGWLGFLGGFEKGVDASLSWHEGGAW
jgi:hypothetical protein